MQALTEFRYGTLLRRFGITVPIAFSDTAELHGKWSEIDAAIVAWLESRGPGAGMILFALQAGSRTDDDYLNEFQKSYSDEGFSAIVSASVHVAVAVYRKGGARTREAHLVEGRFCELHEFCFRELARRESNIEATFCQGAAETLTVHQARRYPLILLGLGLIVGSLGFYYFFAFLTKAPLGWLLMPTLLLLGGSWLTIRFLRVTKFSVDHKLRALAREIRYPFVRRHRHFAHEELRRIEVEPYLALQGTGRNVEASSSVTRYRLLVRLANSDSLVVWDRAEWIDAMGMARAMANMLGLTVKDHARRRQVTYHSPCDIAEQQLQSPWPAAR